jgi:hypothetical protein
MQKIRVLDARRLRAVSMPSKDRKTHEKMLAPDPVESLITLIFSSESESFHEFYFI